MATKFFHQLQDPIKMFLDIRTPKRNGEEQSIPITFRIELNGNNVRSAPPFVREAYDDVKNHAKDESLRQEITMVDVDLFDFPERRKASIRLSQLHLKKLAVKETNNSEGDTSIVLSFETLYPWDKTIWEYVGEKYHTHVFARFDSTQAELLDEGEKPDSGQGTLSIENYRESEQAQAVAANEGD